MSEDGKTSIEVSIRKRLGDFFLDVSFHMESRRIGILGASGSGKSMTLKCIAGIETPDEGVIRVGDRTLFNSKNGVNQKPQLRNVGYLFQNYALFPTMTVAENIGIGVRGDRVLRRERVRRMVEKFSLSGLEERYPWQLSGGQQQRTALARIMAYEPSMLLLDEPFSALDAHLRDALQQELDRMLAEYRGLVILVSHNRDEIYRLCGDLVILDGGSVSAAGPTRELFRHPGKREAARLTGCKNFSDIERIDAHTIRLSDWGITLELQNPVPEGVDCIGYRAHDFIPVWGERPVNSLALWLESKAELPFETNYYLYPENHPESAERICWFVQREKMDAIRKKGLPDYLAVDEGKLLMLKK